MTISDLLTLIGILFAILAVISEKNREYIFLKFSKKELVVVFILFLYIHFLLSFYWLEERVSFLSILIFDRYPDPSVWSYLISIIFLGWGIRKIYFSPFPIENRMSLLKYYKKRILSNDSQFLAILIDEYHLKQIINYLIKTKKIKIEKTGIWKIDRDKYNKACKDILSTSQLRYGFTIYNEIILNEIFLDQTCNSNPYLFSIIIKELNTKELKQEEFVNRFLKILITNKNHAFFKEIKNNQNLSTDNTYRIEKERPILYALFNDIQVSAINEAWRGVGEPAIAEMDEESKKSYSPLRDADTEQENDTIWTYRITIAIWYFDIMVRQAIKQDIDRHMWMFYYWHFCKAILSNMDQSSSQQIQQNSHSRNYDLLEIIFINLIAWLSVVRKTKNKTLLESIYSCIGQCIYHIAVTKAIDINSKIYLINYCFEDLLGISTDSLTEDEIVKYGFKSFLSPISLTAINTDYSKMIKALWAKRDKYKLDNELSAKFEASVINRL